MTRRAGTARLVLNRALARKHSRFAVGAEGGQCPPYAWFTLEVGT